MNKAFNKGLLILLISVIPLSTNATVIYDVVAKYSGEYSSTYTYSFSMEFADNIGVKTETDLIGGHFGDEKMYKVFPYTYHPYIHGYVNLDFDPENPLGIWFSSNDRWALDIVSLTSSYIDIETESDDGYFWFESFDISQLTVTLRVEPEPVPDATVPEPATLALMGLGLAGLGFTRKRSKNK